MPLASQKLPEPLPGDSPPSSQGWGQDRDQEEVAGEVDHHQPASEVVEEA